MVWLRLHDKCGDMGLVCVGIIRHVDAALWQIDTLLMSCRVMGRHVEDAFLAYLAELAQQRGANVLRGVYIPTAKNEPVRDFFVTHGFTPDAEAHDLAGGMTYVRRLDGVMAWPANIRRRSC